ncbi:hypothetical protein Sjap_008285 [Stephania japonica]|uniref:Uncharacterized protein n=1 Tax=Stephania japonica TaxID=461633 RepID=A0AAP0JP73_9MAGN
MLRFNMVSELIGSCHLRFGLKICVRQHNFKNGRDGEMCWEGDQICIFKYQIYTSRRWIYIANHKICDEKVRSTSQSLGLALTSNESGAVTGGFTLQT